jgi:hypothetical protein
MNTVFAQVAEISSPDGKLKLNVFSEKEKRFIMLLFRESNA